MVFESQAMRYVQEMIDAVGSTDTTVLILGESGTGKEMVAQAIHERSSRAQRELVPVDGSGLQENLFESELFGHERGAFTGAAAQRRGRFEQAEGGTLFLDEIGDMPAELQTRLLRVLSDGNYYRVGGHAPLKANVRIIAATHQNLETRVKEGLFREDLFHRLNVIRVRLPSLRERREDIPILSRHFLQKSAQDLGVEAKRFSDGALKYLSALDFPGNVRQLENLCHWLTVMAPGQLVDVADLPQELREATSLTLANDWEGALALEVDRLLARDIGPVHEKLINAFERVLINRALAYTGGRRIEAAQALGIGRNTITRKIQELNLDGARAGEKDHPAGPAPA
jgi:two-component system nitrogen regulation response regulator GlnG